MSKKTVKEIHELFLQNIREENEKERKEIPSFEFNLNLKKKFISVGKETLKPHKMKIYNLKTNHTIDKTKINKTFDKKTKNKNKSCLKHIIKNNIFSDKEYLSYMLNDLKLIFSSIKRKQSNFNASNYNYNNNNNRTMMSNFKTIKNENKFRQYNTYRGSRNSNTLFNNINSNNIRTYNYKPVNLLKQIIGDKYFVENYCYNLTQNNEEKKHSFKENNK
jgi:hypothetical protein